MIDTKERVRLNMEVKRMKRKIAALVTAVGMLMVPAETSGWHRQGPS